jgi:hypothetical protein
MATAAGTIEGFEGVDMPTFGDGDDGSGFAPENYEFGEMDVAGVDAQNIGSGRLKVDKAGFYHFSIHAEARPMPYEKGDMSKQRKPDILITCEVLHSTPGQSPAGSAHFHNLIMGGKGGGPTEKWDRDKSLNFLVGIGVLKVVGGDVIDPETNSTKVNSKTLTARINAVKQFCGKLEMGKAGDKKDASGNVVGQYEARIEFPWGRGAFPVTSPDVAHVPKNLEAIKAAGIEIPAAGPKVNL